MASNKEGTFQVSWQVSESGTIAVTVGGAPKYKTNLKTLEPLPRHVRDTIVSAVEHALSEQFGLLPSLENRGE